MLSSCSRRSQNMAPDPVTGWPKPNKAFAEKSYPILRVAYPKIAAADAEFVDDDELCMTCHEAYVKTFAHNVHRGQ